MKLADFDYALPPERIAQRPAERREDARLLALELADRRTTHARFADLGRWLRRGDLLVLNDTRVIPARIAARKPTGGAVELLLVEPAADDGPGSRWRCLVDASRKPSSAWAVTCAGGLAATVEGRDVAAVGPDAADAAPWLVRFDADPEAFATWLDRHGAMPLPPYIDSGAADTAAVDHRMRYQTVYARRPGAVAAPTAGLHFSPDLLDALAAAGVRTARLTLHVGPGTFLPVRVERVEDHRMHAERYELSVQTAEAVRETRRGGGRVIAVGTTVVRVLEHCAAPTGDLTPGAGRSDLFIYPGHRFKAIDGMITNFHLPRSTLLMLVCAFGGRDTVLGAYREAVESDYRFYSYGDAMLLVGDS